MFRLKKLAFLIPLAFLTPLALELLSTAYAGGQAAKGDDDKLLNVEKPDRDLDSQSLRRVRREDNSPQFSGDEAGILELAHQEPVDRQQFASRFLPFMLSSVVELAGGPANSNDLPNADEQLLRDAGLSGKAGDLLALFKKWTGNDDELQKVESLAKQLESDVFDQRDAATAALVRLGPIAVPVVQRLLSRGGLEAQLRAAKCVEEIQKEWQPGVGLIAARRLARLRPANALPTLLRFLPYAAEEDLIEEIYFDLYDLAKADNTALEFLASALSDPLPQRRAASACIVGSLGSLQQRRLVHKLLTDVAPVVQLRAAHGLLAGKDAAGIPALVELIRQPDTRLSWEAEELLHWSAVDNAPTEVVGAGSADSRDRCSKAWGVWWQAQNEMLDWARIAKLLRRPGLILITGATSDKNNADDDVSYYTGHVCLYGCDGRVRWEIERPGWISSVQLLSGNRILLGETPSEAQMPESDALFAVCERTLSGGVISSVKRTEFAAPLHCQRLPDGNTFVAVGSLGAFEVTPQGQLKRKIVDAPMVENKTFFTWRGVLPSGRIWCELLTRRNKVGNLTLVIECDRSTGRELKRFQINYGNIPEGSIHPQFNGDFLWTLPGAPARILDPYGRQIRNFIHPLRLDNGLLLRNGNMLCLEESRIREFTPEGKAVWEVFPKPTVKLRYCNYANSCLGIIRLGFDAPRPDNYELASDIPYQIRKLQSNEPNVRTITLRDLAEIGPKALGAVPALIEMWNENDERIVAQAHGVVRSVGRGALPDIWNATTDKRPRIRCEALALLAYFYKEDPKIAPFLLAATKDKDVNIRYRAINAVPHIGVQSKECISVLVAALKDTAVPSYYRQGSVASLAARHLGSRFGAKAADAIPALIDAANGKDLDLRFWCIQAMGRIKSHNKESVSYLIQALQSSDGHGYKANDQIPDICIWALGEIGPAARTAIPALTAVLDDERTPMDIRAAAREALKRIER